MQIALAVAHTWFVWITYTMMQRRAVTVCTAGALLRTVDRDSRHLNATFLLVLLRNPSRRICAGRAAHCHMSLRSWIRHPATPHLLSLPLPSRRCFCVRYQRKISLVCHLAGDSALIIDTQWSHLDATQVVIRFWV